MTGVRTESLNPGVVVINPAKDRVQPHDSGALGWASDRRIISQ
jgi:hypothetical protein